MTPASASLIEARRLAVAAPNDPDTAVVNDINWSIRPGEFWVVAGAPGSGKSQLLETLADLTPPHAGELALAGPAFPGASAPGETGPRGRVGLVFAEGGRPFSELTVAQNIGLALCYHRGCRFAAVAAEVQRLLALTELTAWGEALPGRLTSGLRPRLALARALALDPHVLLLDNSLSGLALAQARWWLEFLPRLLDRPARADRALLAIVVTTDDLRPWLSVGTDFALLHEGRWRPVGKRADVAASRDPVVRELLDEG